LHDFADNPATKSVYKSRRLGGARGEMTQQNKEKRPAGKPATQVAATPAKTPAKRSRPLAGFLIAGASLAMLFGIAALKGRVRDDNTDSERGLE
jgi:hypothetical protein